MAVARTTLQHRYVAMLRDAHTHLVVATGCAGTGKTHLAVVEGAAAFIRKDVRRLVLARPAVNAGEQLGFLPGTKEEKLDPFMRPMLDALGSVFSPREIRDLRADGLLEIAPIGYMRGRTFSDSWVVLDEAQNTSPAQMKMALTRLGEGSKMVVCGDSAQSDVGERNGLADFLGRLEPSESISHIQLGGADVQRSQVVREILQLYDK